MIRNRLYRESASLELICLSIVSAFRDKGSEFCLAFSLLQFDSKGPAKLYKAVSRIQIAQIKPVEQRFSKNGHFGGHSP